MKLETAYRLAIVVLLAGHGYVVAADGARMLDTLAAAMSGRFDSLCHCDNGSASPGERYVDSRQRIEASALGTHVLYQQVNRGDNLAVYRQRVLVLGYNGEKNRVELIAYSLREPQAFAGAGVNDPAFDGLTIEQLEPVFESGCEQVWSATETGFIGYVDPGSCRIESDPAGASIRFEARATLGDDGLSLVERGFDDDGKRTFGPAPGESLSLWRVFPEPGDVESMSPEDGRDNP